MKVGCLTLAYNQGTYLQSAISSIKNQENIGEYFIYNPGSTDNTSEIISKNRKIATEIFVAKDLGPADGLNSGFSHISSAIFYYLNADDLVLPGAFAFAIDYFTRNPDCDVLHGAVQIIDQFDAVTRTMPAMNFSLKGYALGYSVVYQQSTFFRSKCLREVGFNVENKTCWDGELIVDLALAGFKIHKTNAVLGQFRIYPESITGSGRLQEQIRKDHARIAHKILGRPLRKSEILLGLVIGKFKAIYRRLFVFILVKDSI